MGFTKGKSVIALLVLATSLLSAEAFTYTVGDELGWTFPPELDSYDTWAKSHVFFVGDDLVFNYDSLLHNVFEVTEAAYQSCDVTNPLATYEMSNAKVTLDSPGTHYYICAVIAHCDAGMKVQVTVAPVVTPPPPPPPPPPPSPSSHPPPPSSPPVRQSAPPPPREKAPSPRAHPGSPRTSPHASPPWSRSPTLKPAPAPAPVPAHRKSPPRSSPTKAPVASPPRSSPKKAPVASPPRSSPKKAPVASPPRSSPKKAPVASPALAPAPRYHVIALSPDASPAQAPETFTSGAASAFPSAAAVVASLLITAWAALLL